MPDDIAIRTVTRDDIPWIVERHAALYAQADGFDASFGQLVRQILDDWFPRHDPARERGFLALSGGQRIGTIFCVRLDDRTAKLRLFLLEPVARGRGLGRLLLAECMGFARVAGYTRMTLWTHESHTAACRLYRATGFACISSTPVRSFGRDLVEQHWQIDL
jgi:GNAT superfamily N-acetyltransferase